MKGVVASSSFFSPCRSFTIFPFDSVAGVVLVVKAVVLVVEVVVVVIIVVVVVDIVVVVVVVVGVVVVVVVAVVVVVVVVGEFLNLIVDIVDLVIFGRVNESVDIMLSVVEVCTVSSLLSSISSSAVDVFVEAVSSLAFTTTRGSAIATLQHTRGRES